MAEPLTEISPSAPPPSSTRPTATPITADQLGAELRKSMAPKLGDQPEPRREETKNRVEQVTQPKEVKPKENSIPTEEQPRHEWKNSPQDELKKRMRERVLDKPKEVVQDEKTEPVEKKEVVSVDDAHPPAKPVDTNEEPPEDERKVLPHDKPATAKRINYFLRENAKLSKELEEARKTATAAPTASNVEEFTKLKEEHAKATDELLRYRRRYDLDNDAEMKAKYDEPVTHSETAIEETLKKYKLGDETLKAIKDAGGFAAFSRSRQTFPVVKEVDGEKQAVQVTASELARGWLNHFDVADAELIRQSVGKQQLLGEEKKQAVNKAVEESKQYFEARQKEQGASQEAAKAHNDKLTARVKELVAAAYEETDWLKDKPIPANASDTQKKEITEYNTFTKQLRDGLLKAPTSPEEYIEVTKDAAYSHHLRRENGSLADQLKAAQAELARVKGATRTTPKAGSLLKAPDETVPEKKAISDNPMADLKANMRARILNKGGADE